MTNSRAMTWAGWSVTVIFALFMIAASVTPKLAHMPVAESTLTDLGWPAGSAFRVGLIELTCLLLYLWNRTAVLGAVLMMGLLGGAIATQFRVGNPLFSHELFGIYLGLLMWGGLWLRDPALRKLFPLRAARASVNRS